MKDLRKYLGLTGLMLLMGATTSCIKDDFSATEAHTANITVNIGSRSGEIDDDNSEVLADEDIKTIRLILVQDGKVVSNSKHDFTTAAGELLLEQGIRIIGLKQVPTDFYAVVNEASVNVNYDTQFKINEAFNHNVFSQAQLVPYAEFNPETNGLPMVGSQSVAAEAIVDNATISIDVTRAVARIDLTINNKTASALEVNQVNFGKFFPDNGFLQEATSGQIFYDVKSFTENKTIAVDGNQTFSYYLYESLQGEAYTVGMTGSNDYDLAPIVDKTTHQTISSLPRNTILKVNATANPTGWELFCNVLPWTKNDVQVDFRDNLSYFSNGWDKNTILPTSEGNLVHIDPLKEAVLTFTIETPNTATWKAQIVPNSPEDINVFEFVGENSGSIYYDESGRALSQELKVRISKDYQESQVEHSATLKVFAEIAGKEYELDLTNTSGQPQEPDEGQSVSRYTLLQKK